MQQVWNMQSLDGVTSEWYVVLQQRRLQETHRLFVAVVVS
jgi:hypothetical protein